MESRSTEDSVIAQVRAILPDAKTRPINRDTDLLVDLNADSLAMASLITALDEEFGDGDGSELGNLMQECRTVGDLISVMDRVRSSQ